MKELVKHRAFRVLLGCILLQACAIGIPYNCLGTFTVAICEDCGFSSGDFGLITTMRLLVNAAFLLIVPNFLYTRWKTKLRFFILGLGSLLFLSFGAGAFTNNIKVWHVIGALMGIGMGMFSMNQTYIIGKWFHKNTNLAIGITSASSGVAGMLLNPVASKLIQAFGWRTALLCICGLGLLMIWLGGFSMRYTPEEADLKPYGWTEGEADKKESAPGKIPPFIQYAPIPFICVLLLLFIFFTLNDTLATSVALLPTYGTELGYGLTVASLFTSFVMIGNIGSKTIYGILYDRCDWRFVATLSEAVVLLGAVGLLLIRGSLPLILFLCIIVGTSQSCVSALMTNLGRNMLGSDRYIRYFSIIQAVSNVTVSVFYAMAGYSYDSTGSFRTCFIVVIAAFSLLLLLCPVLFYLRSRHGKPVSIHS